MASVECSGRGCTTLVPIGDIPPMEAWCSVACAGGVMRQQATARPTSISTGLRAPAGTITAEAPSTATTGHTTADVKTCRRGHPGPWYTAPTGRDYCRTCVKENRAARLIRTRQAGTVVDTPTEGETHG